jgi:anaerobic selenocysteine-containing dehydrogenase
MVHDGALGLHGLSVDALRQEPGGTALLPTTEPGGFLDRVTAAGTLDGAPEMLAPARARAVSLFDELLAEPPDQLKLITRRTSHTLNSAMQNVRRLKDTGAADNPLYVAPDDAGRLGLHDGDRVRIANRFGAIEAAVRVDDTLRSGVVAMTHGFGNAGLTGMAVAAAYPGVNVNALAPHGPGTIDPVSGMSHLTGIAVEVTPV